MRLSDTFADMVQDGVDVAVRVGAGFRMISKRHLFKNTPGLEMRLMLQRILITY
jgi:hypothetical protein